MPTSAQMSKEESDEIEFHALQSKYDDACESASDFHAVDLRRRLGIIHILEGKTALVFIGHLQLLRVNKSLLDNAAPGESELKLKCGDWVYVKAEVQPSNMVRVKQLTRPSTPSLSR